MTGAGLASIIATLLESNIMDISQRLLFLTLYGFAIECPMTTYSARPNDVSKINREDTIVSSKYGKKSICIIISSSGNNSKD